MDLSCDYLIDTCEYCNARTQGISRDTAHGKKQQNQWVKWISRWFQEANDTTAEWELQILLLFAIDSTSEEYRRIKRTRQQLFMNLWRIDDQG